MGAVALAQPWPLAIVIDDVLGARIPAGILQPWSATSRSPTSCSYSSSPSGFVISASSHGVRVVNDYVNAKIEQNMVLDLRSDLFDHVSKLSLTFHDEKHTGMLMSLINIQASAPRRRS